MSTDAVKFALGQIVHNKTDGRSGMVTGVVFRPNGHTYYVTWANENAEVTCFEMELLEDRPFSPGAQGGEIYP